MIANDILTLINFDENEVDSYDLSQSTDPDTGKISSTLYVVLKHYDGQCPHCKSENLYVKEKVTSKVNHSLLSNRNLTVFVTKRRYLCRECHKTFVQPLSIVNKRSRISNQVKNNIVYDLFKMETLTAIAKRYDVSLMTVLRLLDNGIPYQKTGSFEGVICIDEFCFKHGNKDNKYPAVLSNPFDSSIIDIIESRTKPYLERYFSEIPIVKLYSVKYFISDMWEPYRNIKQRYFKNATHIVDLFHIVKAFNESITRIRMKILKDIVLESDKKNKEYKFLKGNWKVFLMNRKKLEKIKKVSKLTGVVYLLIDKVDACIKRYDDLNEVYWNREEFIIGFKKVNFYKDAENLINFSINKFKGSLLPEVNELGRMFQNWKYEIINAAVKTSYGFRMTNAIAESNNNMIQTYIDMCYGINSFKRLRKRVLMLSRERKRRQ